MTFNDSNAVPRKVTGRKMLTKVSRVRDTNLLLTEREGRPGEYWPEVVTVRTSLRSVRTKTTEGQYSPERLELARLVNSLLYGTRAMLVLNLPSFENKKYTAYDRFHGNGPNCEIPTKREPIRTLGFTSRLLCHIIKCCTYERHYLRRYHDRSCRSLAVSILVLPLFLVLGGLGFSVHYRLSRSSVYAAHFSSLQNVNDFSGIISPELLTQSIDIRVYFPKLRRSNLY